MMSGETYNREELLFEYMEGELSPEKRLYVEQLLEEDPALLAELQLWESTVIKEDLPDKLPLQDLYKPTFTWPASLTISISLCSVALICLTFFSLSNAPKTEKQHMIEEQIEIPDTDLVVVKTRTAEVISAPNRAQSAVMAKKPTISKTAKTIATKEKEVEEVLHFGRIATEPTSFQQLNFANITASLDSMPVAAHIKNADVDQKAEKHKAEKKKLSKEEKEKLRRIAKAKQKALELKEQQEFMKGNRPYVVPPDRRNF